MHKALTYDVYKRGCLLLKNNKSFCLIDENNETKTFQVNSSVFNVNTLKNFVKVMYNLDLLDTMIIKEI